MHNNTVLGRTICKYQSLVLQDGSIAGKTEISLVQNDRF